MWADPIEYDVNAWATITAPRGAVENIDTTFLFTNDDFSGLSPYPQEIESGSVNVTSSGFLGTFTPSVGNLFYLGLFNGPTEPFQIPLPDEIDLEFPLGAIGDSASLVAAPNQQLQFRNGNGWKVCRRRRLMSTGTLRVPRCSKNPHENECVTC
jgi:hypothetical protein